MPTSVRHSDKSNRDIYAAVNTSPGMRTRVDSVDWSVHKGGLLERFRAVTDTMSDGGQHQRDYLWDSQGFGLTGGQ